MRMYSSKTAPNPRRVRIFLAEKGIDMTYVDLDLKQGDNRTPEFMAKNMFAKVPVLELDDGTCISETMAICRYFDLQHPEPPLLGQSPIEVATIEMWQRRVEIHLMTFVGFAFRHLTGYFADRETVVKPWGEESLKRAAAVYSLLDSRLSESRFIAGEAYSVADITALCAIDFAKIVELRIEDSQPNLLRWHHEVSGRPSAQA
ncbi:MAG: glutathione S-transferase family protein [bacterium]